MRTDVKFNWLNVRRKVERKPKSLATGSTFTFTCGFSHIVSILFTHVEPVKVYVRTRQLKIKVEFHCRVIFTAYGRELGKCREHSPAARIFHISLVFSNARVC